METREPVVLVVLVEAARLRWLVAAVTLSGAVSPLLRSEEGDLAACQGLDLDNQVSFLRHRLCGVLQRGCDRLWPVGKKACQFVFLFTGRLPGTASELTEQIASHFVEWLLNPPVVVFAIEGVEGTGPPRLSRLAGTLDRPAEDALQLGLPSLFAAVANPDVWEVSTRKGTWQPPEG